MYIHKNARLSYRSREDLSRFVLERVSEKTMGKWVARFRVAGMEGLMDRRWRPHRSPRRASASIVERVVQLRRECVAGYEIARRTGASPATVSRILRRARLSRWRDLNPPPVQRYEHPAPGDLIHLDIKGMTCFSEVSLRSDGRLRGKSKHPGFLALHVAVDDHSRLAFTQMLPDQKADTTIGFLQSAVQFFASHGIQTRALLTDNGSCYRSALFRQACQHMQLKHRKTRPYTPRTNGKAERFIQTALREWARVKHWSSSEQRDQQLKPWNDDYNRERPHGSLAYKPPISRAGNGTTSGISKGAANSLK